MGRKTFDTLDRQSKTDGDETVFFLRQLEYIKAKTYDTKYPELKARALIPMSFEAGAGANSITYRQFSITGIAKIIANYAQDLPRVDVFGKEFVAMIRSLGDSYGWTVQEIRAAQMAGTPLEQRKANAARRGILSRENAIAWWGDADSGLGGMLNNPNITTVSIPADGTGASKKWTDKTPTLILRDLNLMADTPTNVSKGIESADTMLLPLAQYQLIFNTPRSDTTDTSIGKWFLDNTPHIKNIEWLGELDVQTNGNDNYCVVYTRSPDKLTLEVPVDFEQFPVQERNLEFVVPCHERIGGVIIYYPLSIAIGGGI